MLSILGSKNKHEILSNNYAICCLSPSSSSMTSIELCVECPEKKDVRAKQWRRSVKIKTKIKNLGIVGSTPRSA